MNTKNDLRIIKTRRLLYDSLINLMKDKPIEEKGKIYTSIMINNKNSITMDMVYDALDEDVKKRLASFDAPSRIPIEIVSKFYIGAVFNIGIEWLKNRNKYTKEELIKYLEELIPNNAW